MNRCPDSYRDGEMVNRLIGELVNRFLGLQTTDNRLQTILESLFIVNCLIGELENRLIGEMFKF